MFSTRKNPTKAITASIIRIITATIQFIVYLLAIIYLTLTNQAPETGFEWVCMVGCFVFLFIMIGAIVYASTKTKLEYDEDQGDFMCDC